MNRQRHAHANTLLVDGEADGDILVDEAGNPVWPVRTEAERLALEQLADLHSASLREVRAIAAPLAPPSGAAGAVVALDESASALAMLYAHLTARPWSTAAGAGELAGRPSIVVSGGQMNYDVLGGFAGDQRAVGFVFATDAETLRRRILLRAAAARLRGPARHAFAELHATLPLATHSVRGGAVLGGESTAAEVRETLAQGTEVMMLATHSDGVDMMLPGGLTHCAVAAGQTGAGVERPPCCAVTGWCFRHGASVADAVQGGLIVDADEIRARILVLGVCYGTLLEGGPVDPRWGFVERLLDRGCVGTVVAAYGVISLDPALLAILLDRLYGGERVGDAVAAVNASRFAASGRGRFCVLGDPDVRADATLMNGVTSTVSVAPAASRDETPDNGGAAFLRLYLGTAHAQCPDDVIPVLEAAWGAVTEYELAAAQGAALEGTADSPGPQLRETMLAFIHARGTMIVHDWAQLEHTEEALAAGRCPTCHAPTAVRRFEFGAPLVPARRIATCLRCGLVADTPDAAPRALRVDGRTARLVGPAPAGPWTAMLRLGCQDERLSERLAWPATRRGAPVRAVHAPPPWPPGPVRAGFVLVEQASVSLLSGAVAGG